MTVSSLLPLLPPLPLLPLPLLLLLGMCCGSGGGGPLGQACPHLPRLRDVWGGAM